MSRRTVRDFTVSTDVWPILETWARESGCRLKKSTETTHLYQKGPGILFTPMMVQLTQAADKVHLEAWIAISFLLRSYWLFLMPSEIELEASGFWGFFVRGFARKTATPVVNKLLAQFGQPPIG